MELEFLLPQDTTDGVTLRFPVTAEFCRATDSGLCVPLAASRTTLAKAATPKTPVMLRDVLPPSLASGAPHLLTYRITLLNQQGRNGGYSDAAYAPSGAAPAPVAELRAQGSRLGVVLSWQEARDNSDVLLQREDVLAHANGNTSGHKADHAGGVRKQTLPFMGKEKEQPAVVLLNAAGDADTAGEHKLHNQTLDTSAAPETLYRYTAERRRTVQLNGYKLELWSQRSSSIAFTLHDTFAPPVPTDLSAAGFMERNTNGDATSFVVDLIWDPVQDEHLAGYRVYRETLARGNDAGEERRQLLNPAPVKLPSFHDITASGSTRYRYSVTSLDAKGNESDAAQVVLEPQPN